MIYIICYNQLIVCVISVGSSKLMPSEEKKRKTFHIVPFASPPVTALQSPLWPRVFSPWGNMDDRMLRLAIGTIWWFHMIFPRKKVLEIKAPGLCPKSKLLKSHRSWSNLSMRHKLQISHTRSNQCSNFDSFVFQTFGFQSMFELWWIEAFFSLQATNSIKAFRSVGSLVFSGGLTDEGSWSDRCHGHGLWLLWHVLYLFVSVYDFYHPVWLLCHLMIVVSLLWVYTLKEPPKSLNGTCSWSWKFDAISTRPCWPDSRISRNKERAHETHLSAEKSWLMDSLTTAHRIVLQPFVII